jgi:serine/threonine protein kinase
LDDDALGEFAEISPLRSGRLATAYRAREIATGRMVALKLLDAGGWPPHVAEAFERESNVLSSLGTHPHIVTLYRRIALGDGRPVLVLELCEDSLADRIQRGPEISTREAVAIGIKIAGALETAHQGGVLHRDVRAQNILFTSLAEPALGDFGVATLHSDARGGAAALLDIATAHTAPELIEGGQPSPATDVYGLASTLYELLAGAPAFDSYEGVSSASLCLHILRDPAPPIISTAVPLELSDVLLWAMAKDPAARPPTAAWLATELMRIATHHGWPRVRPLVREPAEPVGTKPGRQRGAGPAATGKSVT